jgi:predicted ATPase/class 3 adenylate cyclase
MGAEGVGVIELPTGTVTFLFTDIEGSTRLWQEQPEAMHASLVHHDEIMRKAIDEHHGHVVKTTGDGFHAVFAESHEALRAAVDAQLGLSHAHWEGTEALRVRIGIHTGPAEVRDGDYYGTAVNRAARIMAVAHGDQVLCSSVCAGLATDVPIPGVILRDLGVHRLRDLAGAERLFQVVHDGMIDDFPEIESAAEEPGNLPFPTTDFLGRESELRELAELVDRGRLTTLTGPGGVGKTRLAIEVATFSAARFRDGAWFVDLAPVNQAEFVPAAIGIALRLSESRENAGVEWLARALAWRQALVVLDNCEHVLDAVADVAAALLSQCLHVVMIATSQEVLGIEGERVFGVRPLPLPASPAPGREIDVLEMNQNPSVRLFAERAAAVRHGFVVDATNAAEVGALCARLDGIPLAIELAAARTSSMSPRAILDRLDERFRLLGQGRRSTRRHQTLRAAVDWSFGLLSNAERRVFGRLAVFAGGFSLAAAEQVASGDDVAARDVLDILSGLVEKSMVQVESGSQDDRYRLLETLRDYGLERLAESDDLTFRRRRHAEHYLAIAEQAVPRLIGRENTRALDELTEDHDNFRAALTFLRDASEWDMFERLVVAMSRFWYFRGWLREALDWIEVLLDHEPAAVPRERAQLAAVAATGAVNLARWEQAQRLIDISLVSSQACGEGPRPLALVAGGLAALVHDDPNTARRLGEDAIAIARDNGDAFELSEILCRASMFFSLTSDDPKGAELADEAVRVAEIVGNDFVRSSALEAAGIARYRTDPARAVELLELCWGLSPVRDVATGGANTQMMKAVAHLALRQHAATAAAILRALPTAYEGDEPYYETICLATAAILFRRTARPVAAVRVLATIERLRESGTIVGATRDLESQAQLRQRLEGELPADEFSAAWAEGQALTLDQVIPLVLEQLSEIEADETAHDSS